MSDNEDGNKYFEETSLSEPILKYVMKDAIIKGYALQFVFQYASHVVSTI